MGPETVGVVAIGLMIVLFILGMPVAFAMWFIGVAGFAYLVGLYPAYALLANDIFDSFSSYGLSVIPMFILMGSLAFASGIGQRLYKSCYVWVGEYRGGLTIATVMACAGFAAICGSSAATAATMGRIALPEMKKYGYDDKLATGTVAAAGALGILIPPSTIFIIYGLLTEQSIGKLFVAGILPGLLLTAAFAITVAIICYRHPQYGPPGPQTDLKEKIKSLSGVTEAILLFALAIGGLFLGWFSPTQAAAIGAFGAFFIGVVRRSMSFKSFYSAIRGGLRTSIMVMFIITGATVFGHFMAVTNLPFILADRVGSLNVSPMVLVLVILFIYLIGGCFMDSMALIVVTIPIFYPLIQRLQLDPIWFGVLIVLAGEMGVITPPVGVNVFVIKGIAPDVPIATIFRGIAPFLVALIFVAVLLVYFPILSTFLPGLITY